MASFQMIILYLDVHFETHRKLMQWKKS